MPFPSAELPDDPLVGTVLLGKLRVIRRIGAGGHGVVYEVTHLLTRHRRALKVLRPELSSTVEAVARLVREARVAGQLGSPFLVETYDVGRLPDGAAYVLMELVEGRSLRAILDEDGRMSPARVTAIVAEVCEGLVAVHAAGIVHRDLKPENILIREGAGPPRVKILDFGVLKFTGGAGDTFGALTAAGTTAGTVSYMAPEQIDGGAIDARTDLYALGVVLYEALAGRPPFEGRSPAAVAMSIGRGAQPLAEAAPGVDPELAAIVDRAMRRDPDARFPSAAALRAALSSPGSTIEQATGATTRAERPTEPAIEEPSRVELTTLDGSPVAPSMPGATIAREIGPGSVIDDRFEIERHAGAGGMGAVFRAHDRARGAPAAIKILHHPRRVNEARLAREAEALSALHHPAIVGYVGHGVTGEGQRYLAMEWLEGETLSRRLRRGALSVEDTVTVGLRIAGALEAAHRIGLVHRDVKPGNVILENGDLSAAKVLDFGIVHGIDGPGRRLTATGAMLGTPGYMAPEQARGDGPIDARADVFSMGCVLYECLAGQPAFRGDDVMAVLLKVVLEEAPRAREAAPAAPAALDELIARMLAKDPEARPRDAGEVEAALLAIAAGDTGDSARAAALGAIERRVVCLVLTTPPGERGPPIDLHDAIAAQDGWLDVLADGSLLAVLSTAGSAADLAARAARSALAVRAALPAVTIALVTGRGDVEERRAMGALIDRGAALIARGGEGVRLDEATAGFFGARFDVRGDAAGLWLAGERDVAEAGQTLLGKPAACVGRAREIATLEGVLDASAEEPMAQAIVVIGAPGIGKSRLGREIVQRAIARRPDVEVWIGRGDPLSAGSPFGLLGQAIRRAAGVIEGEPAAAQRAKLRARVSRNVAEHEINRVAEFTGELAGVRFPDGERVQLGAARRSAMLMSDQIHRAWGDLLAAECAAHPLLLVLEDLHWGDRASVELVDTALRDLHDRPFAVLALARPEVDALFPDLWNERRVHATRLGELPRRASEQIVGAALGASITPETAALLVERAAGNAFFLEELIRAVSEGRHEALPETVLAVIEARFERVPSEARRVLRAASVFGRTFGRAGLVALLGRSGEGRLAAPLDELVRREILARRPAERSDEEVYGFRHALVRDAAYATLTEEDRALGHRLAGAFLEAAGERDAVTLAEHFALGGEPSRSIAWYVRAAEQALEGNDFASVIERANKAIAAGAEGEARGALSGLMAEAHAIRGEHPSTIARGREALALLPYGGPAWCVVVTDVLRSSAVLGEAARGAELGRAILALGDSAPSADHARCMARASTFLIALGRGDEAARVLRCAEEIVTRLGAVDPATLGWMNHARSWRAFHAADLGESLRWSVHAVAFFEEAGDRRNACYARVSQGFAYKDVGAYAEAEATLREALHTARAMKLGHIATGASQTLGIVLGCMGRMDEAKAMLQGAIDGFAAEGDPRHEGESRAGLSMILAQSGDLEGAAPCAQRAMDLLTTSPALLPFAAAALAYVRLLQGRADDALAAARSAVKVLAEVERAEAGEELSRLVLAEALFAVGDDAAGRAALLDARDRLLARASSIPDPALRESFLANIWENARTMSLARERLDA